MDPDSSPEPHKLIHLFLSGVILKVLDKTSIFNVLLLLLKPPIEPIQSIDGLWFSLMY